MTACHPVLDDPQGNFIQESVGSATTACKLDYAAWFNDPDVGNSEGQPTALTVDGANIYVEALPPSEP